MYSKALTELTRRLRVHPLMPIFKFNKAKSQMSMFVLFFREAIYRKISTLETMQLELTLSLGWRSLL